MGRFNKMYGNGPGNLKRRPISVIGLCVSMSLILIMIGLFFAETGLAQEKETLAVLPLQVHAQKTLEDMKPSLQEMLTVQLGKRRFQMISPEVISVSGFDI